jgi:hypothetical protein
MMLASEASSQTMLESEASNNRPQSGCWTVAGFAKDCPGATEVDTNTLENCLDTRMDVCEQLKTSDSEKETT